MRCPPRARCARGRIVPARGLDRLEFRSALPSARSPRRGRTCRRRSNEATAATRQAPIANDECVDERCVERPGDQLWEEAAAGQRHAVCGAAGCRRTCGPSSVLIGLKPRNEAKRRRDGRQVRDARGVGRGHVVGDQPALQRVRQPGGEADDHQREEDADREHARRVHERREHAGAGAALRAAASEFITPALFGDENRPIPTPFSSEDQREPDVARSRREARSSSRKLARRAIIPPVANGRAPKRSES